MTQTAVQAQVNAINKATEIATTSKEAAQKFLADAGITQEKGRDIQTTKGKK